MAPRAKKDKKAPDEDPDRNERGKPEKKTKEPAAKKRFILDNVKLPAWLKFPGSGRTEEPALPGPSRPTYEPEEPIDEDIDFVRAKKPTTKGAGYHVPTGAITKRPKKPSSRKYLDSDSSEDEYDNNQPSTSKGVRGKAPPKRSKNIPKYAEDASTSASEEDEKGAIFSRHAHSSGSQPSTSKGVRSERSSDGQYEISGIRTSRPPSLNRYVSWSSSSSSGDSPGVSVPLVRASETSLKVPKNYEEFRLAVGWRRPILSFYPLFRHFEKNKRKSDDPIDDATLNVLRECVREECKTAIKLYKRYQLCAQMNKTFPEIDIFNILFQLKDMQAHFINTIADLEKLGSKEFIIFCEIAEKHYKSSQKMIENLKERERQAVPHLFGLYKYIVTKIQETLSELEPLGM